MAKRKTADGRCPCGSGRNFDDCCGPCLTGGLPAAGPEALMRSRYTAFVRRDRDYLLRTWHPETRPAELAVDEPAVKWTGLEILEWEAEDAGGTATVEFIARYKHGGRAGRLHETSRFRRIGGEWYYLDGIQRRPGDQVPGSGP